jgi:hypothetical protein
MCAMGAMGAMGAMVKTRFFFFFFGWLAAPEGLSLCVLSVQQDGKVCFGLVCSLKISLLIPTRYCRLTCAIICCLTMAHVKLRENFVTFLTFCDPLHARCSPLVAGGCSRRLVGRPCLHDLGSFRIHSLLVHENIAAAMVIAHFLKIIACSKG